MSGTEWMPGLNHRDLRHRPGGAGYDVAGWKPKGIVLHVNDSPLGSVGTSIDWYAAGGGTDQVCPNFQVYPDGTAWQLLPASTQPWCQVAGNQWGVAIETGGSHAEALTAKAAATIAAIVRFMHDQWGVPMQVTNTPAKAGLGTHQMGGVTWGGHPCPGTLRANQRAAIIAAARAIGTNTEEFTVAQYDQLMAAISAQRAEITELRAELAEVHDLFKSENGVHYSAERNAEHAVAHVMHGTPYPAKPAPKPKHGA